MPRFHRRSSILILALALLMPAVAAAQAPVQDPGTVRSQGRLVDQGPNQLGPAAPAAGLLDAREEMRRFIQNISSYARGLDRKFSIVPMDGLELLVKTDPTDPEIRLPATTYMRSIAGVLQTDLFYGIPEIDKPTGEKRREFLFPLAKRAAKAKLPLLVMDTVATPADITAARRMAVKRGFPFFAAPDRGMNLAALPRYPRRPFAENGDSVLSLASIKNFVMLRDTAGFGTQEEFALELHGTNYDLVVVDVFHALGEPLSKRAVETLKYKKIGARRLVFAYVDIATAASYAYYWKPNWREGSPTWISAPTPDDPDKYFVEYWQPEWQQIISGGTGSFLYGIIQQGFDGVILDGVRNYLFVEGGLDAYTAPLGE